MLGIFAHAILKGEKLYFNFKNEKPRDAQRFTYIEFLKWQT